MVRAVVALAPLTATPVLVWAVAHGAIDLGGGEKDLVFVLPWALFALVFAVSSAAYGRRGATLAHATRRSALLGLGAVAGAAAVLALLGQLGVAGRF